MDVFISALAFVEDGDLRLCEGIAYQADMRAGRIDYGDSYHDHYAGLEGTPVAEKLNAGRCAMLARRVPAESSVLDIGAGCGTFVKTARAWGYDAKGFDVIPKTVEVLKGMDAFASDPAQFDAVTFWDSLEHIEDPGTVIGQVRIGSIALVAIPIIEDLAKVRESKHYKPGEHLYYFTSWGFVEWMGWHGFSLLEHSTHEVDAGRENIGAFAFRRSGQAKTVPCPCGGTTAVDSFDWPGKPRQWFLRCDDCKGMSKAATSQAEAARLSIQPEEAA
jgi:hypothetical protein